MSNALPQNLLDVTLSDRQASLLVRAEAQPNGALRLPLDAYGVDVAGLYAQGLAFPACEADSDERFPTLTADGVTLRGVLA